MNYRTKQFVCLLAVCLMLAGLAPARADFIIDDFGAPDAANLVVLVIDLNDPDPSLVETLSPPIPGTPILGGERDVLLDVLGLSRSTSFVGEIGDGTFVFSSSSPGTAATIQYDGVDPDPPGVLVNSQGLGGVDLTAYGDRFALDFLSLDGGGSQFTEIWITVYSPGVGASDLLVELIPDSALPSTYTSPPFANWIVNADPANVTAMEFSLNAIGIDDVDFELDRISIVPEPSSMVLCALGLACSLGYICRRRRK